MWNIERTLIKNQEWKSMKYKIDDQFVCQLLLLWQNAWHKQPKAVRDLFLSRVSKISVHRPQFHRFRGRDEAGYHSNKNS